MKGFSSTSRRRAVVIVVVAVVAVAAWLFVPGAPEAIRAQGLRAPHEGFATDAPERSALRDQCSSASRIEGLVEGIRRAEAQDVEQASDRRVVLLPEETVDVRLRPSFTPGTTIVRADDGGLLDKAGAHPQIELDNTSQGFTFTPGTHRGLYGVSILRGDVSEHLEFWVGPEPPHGRRGPTRNLRLPSRLVAVNQ